MEGAEKEWVWVGIVKLRSVGGKKFLDWKV